MEKTLLEIRKRVAYDLYRSVCNRMNRLARLAAMDAPEIILRNEKKILRDRVEAFCDEADVLALAKVLDEAGVRCGEKQATDSSL